MVLEDIRADIPIEELVSKYPDAVTFLMERNIRCLVCGEPIWGTLADAAREKGYQANELEEIVADLKKFLKEKGGQ